MYRIKILIVVLGINKEKTLSFIYFVMIVLASVQSIWNPLIWALVLYWLALHCQTKTAFIQNNTKACACEYVNCAIFSLLTTVYAPWDGAAASYLQVSPLNSTPVLCWRTRQCPQVCILGSIMYINTHRVSKGLGRQISVNMLFKVNSQ